MTVAIERDPIYRGRRFQSEIIELCVRWYLTYRLSYRDLVEMLAERGVVVSHTTIYRWVQQYVPEFDRRALKSSGLTQASLLLTSLLCFRCQQPDRRPSTRNLGGNGNRLRSRQFTFEGAAPVLA